MHQATAAAHRRLLALTVLLGLGWAFACRPAWGPDGKQVAYPAKVDDRIVLARHDREQGTTEVVFVPLGEKGQCVPQWLPDGSGLVALSSSNDSEKTLRITVMPTDGGKHRVFEVMTTEDASNHMILPAVVLGNALFLGGSTIQRIDLGDGSITQSPAIAGTQEYMLTRRGDGVCYMLRLDDEDESQWELGLVDPTTLRTTRLLASPSDEAWKIMPMPAFTKNLERVAIPAERVVEEGGEQDGEAAILVFQNGKLESKLTIGPADKARLGSVGWGADDVTIFATVARTTDDGMHAYSLFEGAFSDSVRRETPLVTGPPDKPGSLPLAFVLQAALSPDGNTAAITTAYLPHLKDDAEGLLLVDLSGQQRTVTRIPFPQQKREK